MVSEEREAAPGRLELVRVLLNTWLIPNQTRVETDRLAELCRDPQRWASVLGPLPRPTAAPSRLELTATRDGLRRLVENPSAAPAAEPWLRQMVHQHPVLAQLDIAADRLATTVQAQHPTDPAAVILTAVVQAVQDKTWPRLKACPDCRWVFYDHSRSATKTWCGMNATGPNGRACGSIAKVRAYRRRQAQQASPPDYDRSPAPRQPANNDAGPGRCSATAS